MAISSGILVAVKQHSPFRVAVFNLGIRQNVLAKQAKIHESTLSKILHGTRRATDDEQRRLSGVLQIAIAELFPAEAAEEVRS